jgi:adenosylcobinamide kinase/adenosylcobinamide-phosphate guanylyltransferase
MCGMTLARPRSTLAALARRGARTLGGLATVLQPATSPDARVLILGGARSGKSRHAERLLAAHPEVIYLATGQPPSAADPEWADRVKTHQERRPAHWRTVETVDVAAALRSADAPVLVDCLGTWLTRLCDQTGAWESAPGWRQRTDEQLDGLLDAWRAARVPVVAVSNEVGSGVVPETASGRLFRDELGSLNRRVAEASDKVLLMVAGRAIELENP